MQARLFLAVAMAAAIPFALQSAALGDSQSEQPRPGLSSGAFVHGIDIVVPPAPNGAAPRVRVVHQVGSGFGALGTGWALDASSVITRKSATGGVPVFSDDSVRSRFYLDGQKLVGFAQVDEHQELEPREAIPHIWFEDDGVRFEPEYRNGARVRYHIESNTWTVKRNGVTKIYGKIDGAGANALKQKMSVEETVFGPIYFQILCVVTGKLCATSAWYLAKTIDGSGNEILYDYRLPAIPSALEAQYSNLASSSQHLLHTIRYGGNGTAAPNMEVVFGYESRPDPRIDSSSGIVTIVSERLDQIHSTVSGMGTSRYEFTYKPTAMESRDSDLFQSVLAQVDRVSGGTRRAVRVLGSADRMSGAKPTWTSEYQTISNVFDVSQLGEARRIPISVNLNGDGLPDLIVLAFKSEDLCIAAHRAYIAEPANPDGFISRSTATGTAKTIIDGFERKLNDLLTCPFGDGRLGYSVADFDGDTWPDLMIEDGGSTKLIEYNGTPGHFDAPVSVNLDPCHLRHSTAVDVNADGLVDLVRLAHAESGSGANICPERSTTRWIKNSGHRPYIDWDNRAQLDVPLEAAVLPVGYKNKLRCRAVEGGEEPITRFTPPSDPFDRSSVAAKSVDHMRFGDFNGDGVTDVAYALYGCYEWVTTNPGDLAERQMWKGQSGSLYSSIHYGRGDGSYVESGISAGGAVLRWGYINGGEKVIENDYLGARDFTRSGHPAVQRSCVGRFDGGSGCARMNISYDRGLVDGFGLSESDAEHSDDHYQSMSAELGASTAGLAMSDFTGNGFPDRVLFRNGEVYLWRSTQTVALGRVTSVMNGSGGATELTWGFSAASPNDNPKLPANVEVLAAVSGASGTRTVAYGGGRADTEGFLGFVNVVEAGSRGARKEYEFYPERSRRGRPRWAARRRLDGTLEHVTVSLQGTRPSGTNTYAASIVPPYELELLRQCDYRIGHGNGSGGQTVAIDGLLEECSGGEQPLGQREPHIDHPELLPPEWWIERPQGEHEVCPRDAVYSGESCLNLSLATIQWRNSPAPVRAGGGNLSPPITVAQQTASDLRWGDPPGIPLPTKPTPEPVPPVQSTAVRSFMVDYFYEHEFARLDRIYDHRDLVTDDDDLETTHTWTMHVEPNWFHLSEKLVRDKSGSQWSKTTRSGFGAQFNRPTTVENCGRDATGCRTDTRVWTSRGELQSRTFPTKDSFTYSPCGRVETHTDAKGRVRTYTYDSICRQTHDEFLGATKRTQYDGLNRVTRRWVTGVSPLPHQVVSLYDDTIDTVSDKSFVEPRVAHIRADGSLTLEFRDEFGRTTMIKRCTTEDVNPTRIEDVSCADGVEIISTWRGYTMDGVLAAASEPFDLDDTPATTRWTHDGHKRVVVTQSPSHSDLTLWRRTDHSFGPGWSKTALPLNRVVERKYGALTTEVIVAGARQKHETRNVLGQVVTEEGPGGVTFSLSYDAYNQLQKRENTAIEQCWQGELWIDCHLGRSYGYDTSGRPNSTTNLDGTGTEKVLDALGRPTEVWHVVKHVRSTLLETREYTDSPGRVTVKITDEAGNAKTVHKDALGRTETVSYAGFGPSTLAAYTYYRNGQMGTSTDANGLVTTYGYDDFDRVKSVRVTGRGTTRFLRDGAGRPLTVTDADGYETTTTYSYSGKLRRKKLGGLLVENYTYDARGRLATSRRNGVRSEYTFDDLDRLTRIEHGAVGSTYVAAVDMTYDAAHRLETRLVSPMSGAVAETWAYNRWGWPVARTNADGHTSLYEFDVDGRVRVAEDAMQYRRRTTYDTRGRVLTRDMPGAQPTEFSYGAGDSVDGVNRLFSTTVKDGDGQERVTYRDGLGRRVYVDLPDTSAHRYHYDGMRLASRVWLPRTSPPPPVAEAPRAVAWLYDAGGRIEATVGPALETELPLGSEDTWCDTVFCVQSEFSKAGRKLTVETPTALTEFAYDSATGLVASESYLGMTKHYTRDTFPLVTSIRLIGTDGSVRRTDYDRDDAGRLTKMTITTGGDTEVRHYEGLNALGQPASTRAVENGAERVRHEWTYNPSGSVKSRNTWVDGVYHGHTGWRYFKNGVLSSIETPSDDTIAYIYNGGPFDHVLREVTHNGRSVGAFTAWNGRGQPTEITQAAGGRVLGYDELGRTVERKSTDGSGTVVASWVGAFDSFGHLISEDVMDGSGTWTNDYWFNSNGRLRREDRGKSGKSYEYLLDLSGNRRRTRVTEPGQATVVTEFAYDATHPNKLVAVDGVGLAYNPFVEVTEDQHGYSYTRSASGRVVRIDGAFGGNGGGGVSPGPLGSLVDPGGTTVVIARDVDGLPVSTRSVIGSGDSAMQDKRISHYGLDGGTLPIEVADELGNTSAYVVGHGQLLERVDVDPSQVETSTDVMLGNNGSALWVDGDAGTLADGTAFGQGFTSVAAKSERFLFHGMEHLPAAPKIHMARVRMYDPQSGRFNSPDAIGLRGGPHRSQYVTGDPVNYSDAWGYDQIILDGILFDGTSGWVAFMETMRLELPAIGHTSNVPMSLFGGMGGGCDPGLPGACDGPSKNAGNPAETEEPTDSRDMEEPTAEEVEVVWRKPWWRKLLDGVASIGRGMGNGLRGTHRATIGEMQRVGADVMGNLLNAVADELGLSLRYGPDQSQVFKRYAARRDKGHGVVSALVLATQWDALPSLEDVSNTIAEGLGVIDSVVAGDLDPALEMAGELVVDALLTKGAGRLAGAKAINSAGPGRKAVPDSAPVSPRPSQKRTSQPLDPADLAKLTKRPGFNNQAMVNAAKNATYKVGDKIGGDGVMLREIDAAGQVVGRGHVGGESARKARLRNHRPRTDYDYDHIPVADGDVSLTRGTWKQRATYIEQQVGNGVTITRQQVTDGYQQGLRRLNCHTNRARTFEKYPHLDPHQQPGYEVR